MLILCFVLVCIMFLRMSALSSRVSRLEKIIERYLIKKKKAAERKQALGTPNTELISAKGDYVGKGDVSERQDWQNNSEHQSSHNVVDDAPNYFCSKTLDYLLRDNGLSVPLKEGRSTQLSSEHLIPKEYTDSLEEKTKFNSAVESVAGDDCRGNGDQPLAGNAHSDGPDELRHDDNATIVDKNKMSQSSGVDEVSSPSFPFIEKVKGWLKSVNTVVLLGGFILFVGIVFFLQFISTHVYISVGSRLLSVAFFSLALFITGFKIRQKRPQFSMIVQGLSVGIWYLLTVSACFYFHFISLGVGFGLMMLWSLVYLGLSLYQDSRVMAVIGIVGGFVTPLISPSIIQDSFSLLSCYFVLNLVILIVAWFKAWRELNVVGFLFTFVFSSFWYNPKGWDELLDNEIYLIVFFLFYLVVPVLYTARQSINPKGWVDSSLVFGVPFITFGIQSYIVNYHFLALAYSAIVMGVVYCVAVFILRLLASECYRLLMQCHGILAVFFLTLACPLALSHDLSAVIWSLEGVALLYVGSKQRQQFALFTGCILQLASGFHFFIHFYMGLSWTTAIASPVQISDMGLFFVSSVVSVYLLRWVRSEYDLLRDLISALVVSGGFWLFSSTFYLSSLLASPSYIYMCWLILMSSAVSLLMLVYSTTQCKEFLFYYYSLIVFMAGVLIASLFKNPSFLGMLLGWSVAFVVSYRNLYMKIFRFSSSKLWLHEVLCWLFLGVLFQLTTLGCDQYSVSEVGKCCLWLALLSVSILHVLYQSKDEVRWPFSAPYSALYLNKMLKAVSCLLTAVFLYVNSCTDGNVPSWFFCPFLSPVDSMSLLSLLTLGMLRKHCGRTKLNHTFLLIRSEALFSLSFIWINAVMVRIAHFWFHVPIELDSLLSSMGYQMLLSIVYSILAVCIMLYSLRHQSRQAWFWGFGLIVLLAAKLFLFDLSHVNSLERIITFILTGLVLMSIGYFAPLPKRELTASSAPI